MPSFRSHVGRSLTFDVASPIKLPDDEVDLDVSFSQKIPVRQPAYLDVVRPTNLPW